ncbi:ChrR family anti-sigma-E factor [Pseudoalteromonas sp. MMG005]|uniref:ChrR family anti-sigma-E factor n=1 Tax=Pseudoalteromonas sp. MMG005 TaxID=2822682 RepID=UPI001B3A4B78|nr:ChrR family anti-sigma-E factor [Pseudoalteromonas sp. MMG005]MBQ4846817.1 ChrR family anti-sigma-E factor [Pseudoalteromonas sp. MMG005]
MIKHHPTQEMLTQFAEGTLPASLSIAISAHLELCPCCAKQVKALENDSSERYFVETDNDFDGDLTTDVDFAEMLNDITSDDSITQVHRYIPQTLQYQAKEVIVPRAIASIERSDFSQVGKLSRSRLVLEDGELRASLLQIAPGGEIPNHTHTGFELTLLLDGSFEDESGTYVAGDFIWLDGRHSHTPRTENGCLCFTLVNSALHFNKGLSKLLNPIGNLIY